MTHNPASTRLQGDRPPFVDPSETAPSDAGTPTVSAPETAGVSDFAASAAMVNDILAARPAGDSREAAPVSPSPDTRGPELSQPTATGSVGTATTSEFFASAKHRTPFWHKQLSARRPRKGARSERR